MLNLLHGNPLEKPDGATNTSFVLPFRYQVQDIAQVIDTKTICFQPQPTDGAEWLERRRYFTQETACVLYEHAKRFHICSEDWEQFDWKWRSFKLPGYSNDVVLVQAAPPELLLFEYPVDREFRTEAGMDIFHTGFLVVRLFFSEAGASPRFEDLLRVNELFRYWRPLHPDHHEEVGGLFGWFEKDDSPDGNPPASGEAEEAPGSGVEERIDLYLGRWQSLLEIPLNDPSRGSLSRLFPEAWGENAKRWLGEEFHPSSEDATHPPVDSGWITYADNRAFVWTNAVIEGGEGALDSFANPMASSAEEKGSRKTKDEPRPSTKTKPEAFGHWVKLLNVDSPAGTPEGNHAVTPFEQAWCKERTYTRWAHFGSLYGFNYHAGAFICSECGSPPVSRVFRQHYLDMLLLLWG